MNSLTARSGEAASAGPRGGRRQVTIAFVDLVGSTALSHRLDPEDYEEVLGRYRRLAESHVVRFGGHVEQFQGDGILCCFGYPSAHEDDASRAVWAALEIVDAITRLPSPGGTTPLQARVGIATGLTVVDLPAAGGGAGAKATVGGETPNVAARIQAIAADGNVVIAESTRRLVGVGFELVGLGLHTLKGLSQPQDLWRVVRTKNIGSRFEARSQKPVPVVGRDAEIAALLGAWNRAAAGEGGVALISGEPGIGKSHLVRELSVHPATQPHRFVLYQCSPHYENTAFWPLLKHLDDQLGAGDPGRPKIDRLSDFLAAAGISDSDSLPLMAQALSLGLPGHLEAALAYSPEKRRDRTAEILVRIALAGSRQGPPLIVFEDMHWADPSTVELAARLADRIAAGGGLLVVSFRPEFDASPLARAGMTELVLDNLDAVATAALVRSLTPGRRLPDEIVAGVFARTDGVPLFVEELTRSILESGLLREVGDVYELPGDVGALAIPSTLKDSLMARLDRLGPVREIAQIGAAIGREFSQDLLSTVAPAGGERLDDALGQLVGSGLIDRVGHGTFVFRHALIQDAAYESMLRSTRQELHGALAAAISERWPATRETEPEILARHLTRAGRPGEAALLWLRAGQRAMARSALAEAIAHFTTALAVVESLPRDETVDDLELAIRVGLGAAYIAQRGWASDRVRQTVSPARALAARSSNVSHLVTTLFQVWVNFHTRCDFPSALEVAEELIERGRQRPDEPALMAHGYGIAAQTLYFVGRLTEALDSMAMCRRYADFERDREIVANTNHEVQASSQARVGTAHWILGFPDQALASAGETIDVARRTGHPFNLAFVLAVNSHTHFLLGDLATAAGHIDESIAIAANQRLAWLQRMTLPLYVGRKLLHQGRFAEGLKVSTEALDALRRGSQRTTVSSNLMMLGRLLAGSGEVTAGLAQVEASLSLTDETGERCELPELWRIKGELLERLDRPADAEAAYQHAIAIARELGAKGWELRVATNLATLWLRHDRDGDAVRLLRPIRDWFTEGLGTPDVIRATQVLEELASGT